MKGETILPEGVIKDEIGSRPQADQNADLGVKEDSVVLHIPPPLTDVPRAWEVEQRF